MIENGCEKSDNFGETYQTLDPEGDEELAHYTCWQLPRLHKIRKGSKKEENEEKKMLWQIKFDGKDTITYSGQNGGKVVVHSKKVTLASKHTLSEQAFVTARKEYRNKQIKEGYVPENQKAKKSRKPMSGEEYKPESIEKFPVYLHGKLDGVRCTVHGGPKPISRYGKEFYYLDKFYPSWQFISDRLPKGSIPEGELIGDDPEAFEKLISSVRRSKNKNPEVEHITFFMFDFIPPEDSNLTYQQRLEIMRKVYGEYSGGSCLEIVDDNLQFKPIVLLDAFLIHSHEEIQRFHKLFRQLKFEGTIVRQPDSFYIHGRGRAFMKIIDKKSEEFPIIDVEPAGGQDDWASLVVIDKQNRKFTVTAPGTHEDKKRMLIDKDNIIGKLVTVEYREFTKKGTGVPRFPIAKCIRDYE